jgi:hypothetical protein
VVSCALQRAQYSSVAGCLSFASILSQNFRICATSWGATICCFSLFGVVFRKGLRVAHGDGVSNVAHDVVDPFLRDDFLVANLLAAVLSIGLLL